jgi:hypothetical protein
MLKFFFWLLLLANAALFAYQRGYLESLLPSDHEPTRVANQFNADKIKLIPAPAANDDAPAVPEPVAPPPAAPGSAAVPATAAVAAAMPPGCTEIGNFTADEAQRFSVRLASLDLGERLSQHAVQETVTHIVYIPPQGDKDGADRKAGELRRLGIKDFFVIQDDSPLRWGISLGVFKQESAARAHLASLNQKGVHSARIGTRGKLVAFQLRALDPKARNALEQIKTGFPKQQMRECSY